jgi:hypothetical protein
MLVSGLLDTIPSNMLHLTIWAARFLSTSTRPQVYAAWFYPLNVIAAIGATSYKTLSRSLGLLFRKLSSLLSMLVSLLSMLATISSKTTTVLISSIAWLSSVRSPPSSQSSHRSLLILSGSTLCCLL